MDLGSLLRDKEILMEILSLRPFEAVKEPLKLCSWSEAIVELKKIHKLLHNYKRKNERRV